MHRPHLALRSRLSWYDRWHAQPFHGRTHAGVLIVYVLVVGLFAFNSYRVTQALADLADNWDFATGSQFTLDNGIELNGTSARLKAQNYTADEATRALFHLDEQSGTDVADSSGRNNNATVGSSAAWAAGNLNNALSLNGSQTYLSVPDSDSISLTGSNTIEAWTKLSENFGAGTHDHKQGIAEKGSYRLYYDQETGKITYELANAAATNWTQQAGNDINGSWDLNGKLAVNALLSNGSDVYAGLGNAVGDAEVWKWNGTTWTQIGGDGLNGSWANQMFENVLSLARNGDTLYAGLGSGAGDAEVWSCNIADNCQDWTKIGGDGLNGSWAVNTFEEVESMTVMGGNLYAGLGNSANDARVYRWNGTSWTWVGGFGIGAPYNAFTTGYEGVYSMSNDGTNLYVGFGTTAGDADVWRLSGTAWTQIGGDAVNGSWAAATFETVISMRFFNGNLYAGLGTTAGDADLWRWNGTAWTQIGGDGLNGGWAASTYEGVYSLTDDGTNLYAGLGNTAGDNEVYRYNGTAWTKIGGDGLNGGFTTTHTVVQSMTFTGGTLYAGLQATGAHAETWSFNGTTWTRMGGGYINDSWGYYNLQNIESMTVHGDSLYAGTGNATAGNAMVWRFDGSAWRIVGGQGVNGSWPAVTYEDVMSMISFGGNLYVGLGTTAGDAEVWRYNGLTWSQIGGDGLSGSWGAGYEEVSSMAVLDGNLYAGIGSSASDAEVYRYNGTAWTKIGGDGLNSGWTTGFDRVSSMAIYKGQLYVGLGVTATEAEVWRWNGTAWTKIGGDGLSSSWNTSYEQVEYMVPFNGRLYAGIGNSTGDAEIWEYDGTAWSQIGGDGLSDSWLDGQYEHVKSLVVYNGKLYAGLGNSTGDGEVWEFSGGTWSRVGGSGVNGSWAPNTIETIHSFSVYRGKLYAGLGATGNSDAQIWSYGNNGFVQSSQSSHDTGWHHIAATYDGVTMKIFIDGVQSAQADVALTMPDGAQPLLIGSTFGTSEAGWSQGYFEGVLDEVRISSTARSGFITKPYASTPQAITLTDSVRRNGVWHWDDFIADEAADGGSVTYRLSDDDGATWQYWNGTAWAASGSASQANTASDIDSHIATFPVTFKGIKWQAVLSGDGNQRVGLNGVTLQSTSDVTVPTTASVSVSAAKALGGSALAGNAWTNGGSPAFDWTDGSDTEAGVKGYCAYLGNDNTADPVTSKGLLGTSPLDAGGYCQYAVAATDLDLGVAGTLVSQMTTTNTPYYLTVKAIDNAGNVSSDQAQFNFRFDNTPPSNPAFITAPSGFVNTKAATLYWPTSGSGAPSDTNSGLSGLQYRIGSSGTWYGDSHAGSGDNSDLLANDGTYAITETPDYDNLIEGVNTIYFRTWDAAGNVTSSYVTAALKINTAGAPSEPQNVTASPATNTTNAFSFDWDAPATFVGDAANLRYCYTVNALPSESTCTYTGAGVTSLGSGPYATQPGSNTFYVVARDESNNINYSSYSTVSFSANTPAPGIPVNVDIVDVSIKSTSNWRLALTWDAPSYTGAGIAAYKVYRSTDNTSFASVGSSSSTTYIDAGLSQRRYYYRVVACDSTNNCGANSSTVNQLPTGKFTSPAELVSEPVVSNITTKRASISWSTNRASDSKVAIGTASGKYSPSEIGSSDQSSAHGINLENLSAGTTYYFVAKWTDEDGNTGVSQEYSFTTSPPPSLKEIETLSVGLSSAAIQFTSKNATKVALYYGQSEAFGGLKTLNTSNEESTYAVDITGLSDGTKYFYKLVSYDSEGNSYEGSVFSFSTPPRPRITDLRFQPVAGEPTSTQRVSWRTNVPATSTVAYGKVGSSALEVNQPGTSTEHEVTIRNLEDDSEYYLLAQSRDRDGNLAVSDRQVFRTALDTRPPKITDITIESSIRGTGAEARGQVVVSWRTDELSTSQVAYAEGSDVATFNNRTAEDTGLSFEHIVIVSDLPTSKVYSIQPISRDKSGNAGTGQPQSAIIGRASDSVLTIVLDTLKKVFGF